MKSYETKNNGSRQLYKCEQCNKVFSETINTFLKGIIKPISFIIQVLNARNEGTGLNAVCRIFKIAKNTLLNWEKNLRVCRIRFSCIHYHSPF
jgi:transposase-like protein